MAFMDNPLTPPAWSYQLLILRWKNNLLKNTLDAKKMCSVASSVFCRQLLFKTQGQKFAEIITTIVLC